MKYTLLLEIIHPERHDDSLHLMSGQEFDVLHTDSTGREVYGLAHDGKEYLLFPLGFETQDRGVVAVSYPSEYHDFFTDWGVHGARVRFSSPQGIPFFSGQGEEFQSSSGVLHCDSDGRLSILLDHVAPGALSGKVHEASPPGMRAEHDADSFIFEASVQDEPEAGHGHHEHGANCGCGHDHEVHESAVRAKLNLDASQLADIIRKRTEGLDMLLNQAAEAGLIVELVLEEPGMALSGCPRIAVKRILQPL